jgi:AcrR family transcriptional regulator
MKALMPATPTAATATTATVRDARRPRSARDHLLAAALRRFGEDGTVAVNLEEVRQEAGVSVGALYHHFADKAALVDALYAAVTARFQEGFLEVLQASPSAEDGIRRGVRYFLRWVGDHRHETAILLGARAESPELTELNRRFFSEVMAWWRMHAHYGAVRSLPLELIHALWLGPAQEYTRHWNAGHGTRSPAAVGPALEEAAWNALKGDR